MKLEKLKEYREKFGYTQADMARELGITTPNYNQKENRARKFTPLELHKIQQLFKIHQKDISIENIFFEQ